jgi:hypothetical protein
MMLKTRLVGWSVAKFSDRSWYFDPIVDSKRVDWNFDEVSQHEAQ